MYAFFELEFSYSTMPFQEKLTITILKSQISQIILNNLINIRAKPKKENYFIFDAFIVLLFFLCLLF